MPVARRYKATVLPGNNHALLQSALAARPWWHVVEGREAEGERSDLWWGGNGQPYDWAGLQAALPRAALPVVNKHGTHSCICTKARLAHSLRRYARASGVDLSTIVPQTFVLVSNGKQQQVDAESAGFRAAAATAAACGLHLWIVKPGNSNRGRGIKVFDTAKAVELHVRRQKLGSEWVVQKYIEPPLLLGGRKFDIRQFALVTCDRRVFAYRDSYVRTCSRPFDASDTADLAAHLSNDYVQKALESFGRFEDANKLSFEEFQAVLDETPLADGRTLRFEADLWPQVRASACAAASASASASARAREHRACIGPTRARASS